MSENKNNDKTENSGAKVYEFDQKRNKADEIGEADDNGDELIRRKKAPVLRKRNKDNNEKRNSKYGMISVVIVILLIVFICADIYTGGALAAVSGQISAFFSKSSTEKFSVKTDAQTVYDFSSFGDGFALLADSGIIHVDSSGRISSKQQLSYNKPAVEICGKRALIFDRGGKSYTLEKNGSVYSQLTVEDKIIDAALSKKDNYALAVKGENSKTILYGFDNSGKVIYQWDCPDGYIADIAITPSGGKAAATVINSSNAVLSTQIYILDFEYNSAYADFKYENEIVVGTKFVSDSNILVITDKKVYLINKKDQSILYDYNSADICHYDCDDGKFSAVITTDHRDDNSYTLTVFDKNGKLMFSQALFGKVRGVSCSDRCVSVLFADKVETYSKKGKLVGNVTDVKHCDDIVLNGNYIYILTSDSVRKFAAYGMTEYAVQSEPVSVVE